MKGDAGVARMTSQRGFGGLYLRVQFENRFTGKCHLRRHTRTDLVRFDADKRPRPRDPVRSFDGGQRVGDDAVRPRRHIPVHHDADDIDDFQQVIDRGLPDAAKRRDAC